MTRRQRKRAASAVLCAGESRQSTPVWPIGDAWQAVASKSARARVFRFRVPTAHTVAHKRPETRDPHVRRHDRYAPPPHGRPAPANDRTSPRRCALPAPNTCVFIDLRQVPSALRTATSSLSVATWGRPAPTTCNGSVASPAAEPISALDGRERVARSAQKRIATPTANPSRVGATPIAFRRARRERSWTRSPVNTAVAASEAPRNTPLAI